MRTELDRLMKDIRVQAQTGVIAEKVLMGLTAGTCLALIAYFTLRGNMEAAADVQNFKDRYFGSSSSSPYVSGDAVFSPATEIAIGAMTPMEIDAIAKDFSQGRSFTDVGSVANPFVNEYGSESLGMSFAGNIMDDLNDVVQDESRATYEQMRLYPERPDPDDCDSISNSILRGRIYLVVAQRQAFGLDPGKITMEDMNRIAEKVDRLERQYEKNLCGSVSTHVDHPDAQDVHELGDTRVNVQHLDLQGDGLPGESMSASRALAKYGVPDFIDQNMLNGEIDFTFLSNSWL